MTSSPVFRFAEEYSHFKNKAFASIDEVGFEKCTDEGSDSARLKNSSFHVNFRKQIVLLNIHTVTSMCVM